MVIRMSQNTQVARTTLATVCREISAFFTRPQHSSEHWQVVHSETSELRARRVSVVVASLSCVLLALGCNVYDPSLLEPNPLLAGGADGGANAASGGGSLVAGAPGASGGNDSSAGGVGNAGALGGNGSAGGTKGGSGGSSGSSSSSSGASTAGTTGVELGGSPAGGAANVGFSVIDDMENPDQYIPTNDLRQGFWSLSNDNTAGKQTPTPVMIMSAIPGARGSSLNGLHTTSSGFTKTGALVSVDLNRKGSARSTYDASAYKSVKFWARVETSSAADTRFAILDRHTDPGGALCCPTMDCTTGNISNGLCYDHFHKDVTFTHAWAEYTVTFAPEDLKQDGWGDNKLTALDAAHIFGIQLSWGTAAMDLWLDDIVFEKK